jgi:hypothetical protein
MSLHNDIDGGVPHQDGHHFHLLSIFAWLYNLASGKRVTFSKRD